MDVLVKLLVDIFSNGANAKSCAFEKKYADGADVLHTFFALKEVKSVLTKMTKIV